MGETASGASGSPNVVICWKSRKLTSGSPNVGI